MKQEILKLMNEQKTYAEINQSCLRKAVGCSSIGFDIHNDYEPMLFSMAHNGPSVGGAACSNEVGNCGCSHAESRVVQKILKKGGLFGPQVMLCTYSPCTNCANIIIDSGLFVGVIYETFTEHDSRGVVFLNKSMGVMSIDEMNNMSEGDFNAEIKKWLSC